jgi:hypothetical protein
MFGLLNYCGSDWSYKEHDGKYLLIDNGSEYTGVDVLNGLGRWTWSWRNCLSPQ